MSYIQDVAKLLASSLQFDAIRGLHYIYPIHPQLVYACLACLGTGLIAVPMSIKLKAPEINYILAQTKPVYFISHHEYLSSLRQVNFDYDGFKKLFIVNGYEKKLSVPSFPFDELLKPSSDAFSSNTSVKEAAIFFTSAYPKG